MPPSRNSRYINSRGMQDTDGRWFLSLPTPVRYRDMPTNRTRTCEGGETWWGLAETFYGEGKGIKWWWALMNFQSELSGDAFSNAWNSWLLMKMASPDMHEKTLLDTMKIPAPDWHNPISKQL